MCVCSPKSLLSATQSAFGCSYHFCSSAFVFSQPLICHWFLILIRGQLNSWGPAAFVPVLSFQTSSKKEDFLNKEKFHQKFHSTNPHKSKPLSAPQRTLDNCGVASRDPRSSKENSVHHKRTEWRANVVPGITFQSFPRRIV